MRRWGWKCSPLGSERKRQSPAVGDDRIARSISASSTFRPGGKAAEGVVDVGFIQKSDVPAK